VPAERRKLHAHIDPRNGDSADLLLVLLAHPQDGVGRLVDVVEVEERSSIIEVLIHRFGGFELREAGAILVHWQIGSILDSYLMLLQHFGVLQAHAVNNLPILILHLRLSRGARFLKFELVLSLEVLSIVGEGLDVVLLFFFVECLDYNR
jgi:hypothetical protein